MALFDTFSDKLRELYIRASNPYGKNFVVKYKDERIHISSGKVSKDFVEDCRKLCIELELNKALIMGCFDDRMVLHFSRNIKKKDHQKFRNIWHANL